VKVDFLTGTIVIAVSIGLGLTLTQGVFLMVFRLAKIVVPPQQKRS
jgi:hypothetical protein